MQKKVDLISLKTNLRRNTHSFNSETIKNQPRTRLCSASNCFNPCSPQTLPGDDTMTERPRDGFNGHSNPFTAPLHTGKFFLSVPIWAPCRVSFGFRLSAVGIRVDFKCCQLVVGGGPPRSIMQPLTRDGHLNNKGNYSGTGGFGPSIMYLF